MSERDDLPTGWTWTTLGAITAVNPRINSESLPGTTQVSFVPMAAVEAGTGQLDVSASRPLAEVRRGYTSFQDGDVLFAKITPCMENGKAAVARSLVSGIGFGSTEFHVLRPATGVDAQLLYYFVAQETFRQSARAHMTGTAGQLRVPTSYLSDTLYPLAPFDEQRRIVAAIEEQFTRLDAGVAALRSAQTRLKHYRATVLKAAVEGKLTEAWRAANPADEPADALLARILAEHRARREADLRAKGKDPAKARYQEPVAPDTAGLPDLPEGWCWAMVEQLNPPTRPCAYGVLQPGPDTSDGVPFVRVGDINDGRVHTEAMKRIAPTIAAQYPRTKLEGGEILITLVGTIGRTAVAPASLAGANTARAVGVIPLMEGIAAPWVEIWFRNPAKVQEMVSRAHEVARKTLNLEDVRAATVALPPQAEQERIVLEVDQRLSVVEELETAVEANLKRADRLRQSILREAFAGRLVPQDPSDEPASAILERVCRAREERAAGNGKVGANGKAPRQGSLWPDKAGVGKARRRGAYRV